MDADPSHRGTDAQTTLRGVREADDRATPGRPAPPVRCPLPRHDVPHLRVQPAPQDRGRRRGRRGSRPVIDLNTIPSYAEMLEDAREVGDIRHEAILEEVRAFCQVNVARAHVERAN